ncbi:hypothetical protein [Erythrobacter sp. BLCC-B19]|uniref:hypothetical protein n=1 Tax=Erythrobacter sp. BLCC-B19 TaxID=3025315 RepID=UPI002362099C|nr:hypothetical protein [Erythrobacter sp. BLCC-B19]WDA40863.1 hypothetical protein PS060_15075 [Erythrobacter sp. BLCC-B19]
MTRRWPRQIKALSLLACLLSGPAGADDETWREEFPQKCIFPADGLEEPEPCRSFHRVSDRRSEDGEVYTIYEYKWISADGREVVYTPDIGGFAISRFTIGTLHDNRYDGGRTFKPAVSHTLHRDKTVIGAPGELYLFAVCGEYVDGKPYNCD